jgi:hypothetical protein
VLIFSSWFLKAPILRHGSLSLSLSVSLFVSDVLRMWYLGTRGEGMKGVMKKVAMVVMGEPKQYLTIIIRASRVGMG